MKAVRRIVLAICAVAVSFAVWANSIDIPAAPGSIGNPIGSTQATRNTEAYNAVVNFMGQGMTIVPGDWVVVTFGDGWKQIYDFNLDAYNNPVIGPRTDPFPTNYAGGGNGPVATCTGYYRPVYQHTVVTADGTTWDDYVFMGYEWTGGNC